MKNLWFGTAKILRQDWAMTSTRKELHTQFVSIYYFDNKI